MSEAISEFTSDIRDLTDNDLIILAEITSLAMTFAVDYIIKHHLTVNDAIHLYSALTNATEQMEFISADKNLNIAAAKEGLKVYNPEE